jgi:hypothetical protein
MARRGRRTPGHSRLALRNGGKQTHNPGGKTTGHDDQALGLGYGYDAAPEYADLDKHNEPNQQAVDTLRARQKLEHQRLAEFRGVFAHQTRDRFAGKTHADRGPHAGKASRESGAN